MSHSQSDSFKFNGEYWQGTFFAMASPCEILIDCKEKLKAESIYNIAKQETLRIEKKFSRYRNDNIIHEINTSNGSAIKVDEETAHLLDYAEQCYQLSDGLFDITSGVLRKIWTFDGNNNIPNQKSITETLNLVGWEKITWEKPYITLNKNMQIDLGGIGKEFAVDRVSSLLSHKKINSILINFGGDIRALGPRSNSEPWDIGIINPDKKLNNTQTKIKLRKGAVATSGDLNRFLLKDGIRYSHLLNPKTGWPVKNAPRQISVLAPTCLEAGMLASFACLQGKNATHFLKSQDINCHITV